MVATAAAPDRTVYLAAYIYDAVAIVVSLRVIENTAAAGRLLAVARRHLGREVVLVAPSRRARVVYHGRADIARRISRVPLDQVRWTQVALDTGDAVTPTGAARAREGEARCLR